MPNIPNTNQAGLVLKSKGDGQNGTFWDGSAAYESLTGAGESATPGALVQAGPFMVRNTAAFGSGTGIDLLDTGDAGILITNNGTNSTYASAGIAIIDHDLYGIDIGIGTKIGGYPEALNVWSQDGININGPHSSISVDNVGAGIAISTDSTGPLTISSAAEVIIENTNTSGAGVSISDAGTTLGGVTVSTSSANGISLSSPNSGLLIPAMASAPPYKKGAMYYDTTLSKLRIGGATAWETVTSA